METGFIVLGLCAAAGLIAWGIQDKKNTKITLGLLLAGGMFLCFGIQSMYRDAAGYQAIGQSALFGKMVLYRVLFAAVGGAIGFFVLWFLTLFVFEHKRAYYRWIPTIAGAYYGAKWGSENWASIFLYVNGTKAITEESAALNDAGFYLLSLPFYNHFYSLLFGLCLIGLLSVCAGVFLCGRSGHLDISLPSLRREEPAGPIGWLYVNIALFLLVMAGGQYLNRFYGLYAYEGVLLEVGRMNAHFNLPVLLMLIAVLAASDARLMPDPRRLTQAPATAGYSIPIRSLFGVLLLVASLTVFIWGAASKPGQSPYRTARGDAQQSIVEEAALLHSAR
jgi:uncharacterized membrane protein (UPF0182 family)